MKTKPNNNPEWVHLMADLEDDDIQDECDAIHKFVENYKDYIFFRYLVKWWKEETKFSSSMTEIINHPAYKGIIWLGDKAIPFILDELKREPNHYFAALKQITGKDPVPEEFRGNMDEMTRIWIKELEK